MTGLIITNCYIVLSRCTRKQDVRSYEASAIIFFDSQMYGLKDLVWC